MKLLGSHIITSPLLSYLKTTSICSHQFEEGGSGLWEQGMNWSNFAEVRKLERETRKGLMTFEGIGVVELQVEYLMTSCLLLR